MPHALQAMLVELARARVHGFSVAETDAACRRLMSDFEATFLERDQVYSEDWRQVRCWRGRRVCCLAAGWPCHERLVRGAAVSLCCVLRGAWLLSDAAALQEYERHFLAGELVAGREYEARLSKTMLPLIRPDDLRAVAQQFSLHCSCCVLATSHRRCEHQPAHAGALEHT